MKARADMPAGDVDVSGTARQRRIPGEAGAWVFILADMSVFVLFFHVFVYYRAADSVQFAASQAQLNQNLGAANTLLLLTSSWLVVRGMSAAKDGLAQKCNRLLGGALACGVGFCGVKIYEYAEKLGQGFTPKTDDFFMYYYIFTGIHFVHVIIGCGVLVWMQMPSRRAVGAGLRFMESGACFWHMVDLLWIVLFPLIYLSR